MEQKRKLIFFKNYFDDFFKSLSSKVQEKIDYALFLVTVANRIPSKFFEHVTGTDGLFEIRIEFESNIYRIFCCFDKGNLVVLFNGFQKKTQKTPKSELEFARQCRADYLDERRDTDE